MLMLRTKLKLRLTPADKERRLAQRYGFASVPDPRRGARWSKFVRGEVHIWQIVALDGPDHCIKWQTAHLIDGRFMKHEKFSSLVEALKAKGSCD